MVCWSKGTGGARRSEEEEEDPEAWARGSAFAAMRRCLRDFAGIQLGQGLSLGWEETIFEKKKREETLQ